ncbi:rhodanese-like domain-containing protein [Cytobacillus suaedae]|nr:rhodanese-like domain-containing protein [Cytobacillus suaedae]
MSLHKITPEKLYERLQNNEKLMVLDVRAEEKYKIEHIEHENIDSRNIPKTVIFELENGQTLAELPQGEEIIVTCTTGNSASKCANLLMDRDYNVVTLEGGLTAWKEFLNTQKKTY